MCFVSLRVGSWHLTLLTRDVNFFHVDSNYSTPTSVWNPSVTRSRVFKLFTYCLAVVMCSSVSGRWNLLPQLNGMFCSIKNRFWNCISASFSLYLFLPSFFPTSFISFFLTLFVPFLFVISNFIPSSFIYLFIFPLFPLSVIPYFFSSSSLYLSLSPFLSLSYLISFFHYLSLYPFLFLSCLISFLRHPFIYSFSSFYPTFFISFTLICLLVSPTPFFVMPFLISLFLLSYATTESLTNITGIDTTFFRFLLRKLRFVMWMCTKSI